MDAFDPLRLDSGTANRDKNAKRRNIDEVLHEGTIAARPFYKRRRFYPPWNLPSIHRFDSPEQSISENGLFVHEIKWDDKTTGVHTFDILCDTIFFGHDIGKHLIQGDFLLLYTGPQNLRNTLINAKLQRDANFLPSGQTDSNVSKLKRVVPLNKLLQLINDCVKLQRDYFDHRHVDITYTDYVNEITKKFQLGGIVSLLSRLRTPDDMWRYFKPLGFLHSFDGKPVYGGNSCPLISVLGFEIRVAFKRQICPERFSSLLCSRNDKRVQTRRNTRTKSGVQLPSSFTPLHRQRQTIKPRTSIWIRRSQPRKLCDSLSD